MYYSDVNFMLFVTYSITHRVHTWLIPFTYGYKTYLCLSEWNSYEISSAVSLLHVFLIVNLYPNINVKHPNGHGIFNSCEFLFQTQHFGRVRFSVTRYQFLLKRKSPSLEGSRIKTFVSGEGDFQFL